MRPVTRRPRQRQPALPLTGIVEAIRKGSTGTILLVDNPMLSDEDIEQIIEKTNLSYLSWPGSNTNYFVLGVSSFDPSDDESDWILG